MSRWPLWASAPERASDTTGCSRRARGPRLPARPGLQVPLDCGQGGRAGSWRLGPRNVCTRPGIVGFPVRRGPPGRSEERNGRQGGSACRWPQVFHTQGIILRPMTLFNPVFNCLTPKGIKRSKTQAEEGLTPADEAGSVVLRQPPASKLANLFRIDVLRGKTGLTTQENECEKGKLRLRENRCSPPQGGSRSPQRSRPAQPVRKTLGQGALHVGPGPPQHPGHEQPVAHVAEEPAAWSRC